MIVGLFTDLSQVGGIQQVSRHAGAVLHEFALAQNQPCCLLGLNDARGPGSFEVGNCQCPFEGFARHKAELLWYWLRLAPRIRLAFLGHPNLAPFGLLLRSMNRRARYLVAAHGMEVWDPLPALRRVALRRADGITSVSAFTAEQMRKAQQLDSKQIFVLPPALDPGFAEAIPADISLPLPPQSRIILSVGRLLLSEPGKGVDTVIRALPKLRDAFPNLCYVVVGDGDARPALEQLAQRHGVADRVIFAGEQKLAGLKACYCASEVFVMPSRQEGFGVVFLEAMFLGKPVIAGNHGGAPEVVREGVTGFLVRFDDADGLAERLAKLLGDGRLRVEMGEAGRRAVAREYSFEQFRSRMLRAITEVLA